MILRVVGGRVPPGELDAVVASFRRDYAPIANGLPGLDRYVIAARPDPDGHELAVMTTWTTVEATIAVFDGDLARLRTLDDRAHGETLSRVDHYEVDEGGARRRPGGAAYLRLTAGRVASGLEADLQQEIRRRMAELPDEAIEAFVGRRVVGADVEIALVTTWTAVPTGTSLEAPIWPSIADRYAAFRVSVLDVLLEGSGAG